MPQTVKQLCSKIDFLVRGGFASKESRVLFVDDGSRDRTWELIASFSEKETYVCGLRLSRNCGHQNALLAGLMTAKDLSDAVISLDADLQDDVEAIPNLYKNSTRGTISFTECVRAVRPTRRLNAARRTVFTG